MGLDHIRAVIPLIDEIDRREGMIAFERYRALMQRLANHYSVELSRVIGGFVALSPNND